VTDVRTARAAEKPCELYRHHSPRVVRTQGHHRKPVYLQNKVFGRIQDPELLWVCGSCHDALHSWIAFLLDEWGEPKPRPGRNVKVEAQKTVDWYRAAMAERDAD
jgi:hypothetical protein